MVKSITHIVLEPRYSGAEILVLNLVRSQLEKGIASGLISLKPSHPNFENELESISRLGCELAVPYHALSRLQRIAWIKRSVRRFNPDVVVAHTLIPSVYARLALMSSRVPVASVLHANDDFKGTATHWLERLIWRRNSALVAVNHRSIVNYKLRVTNAANTRIIPNGIDLERYSNIACRRDLVRKQLLGDCTDRIIILQVGRLYQLKQQCVTAESVADFCRNNPEVPVTLVFAGPTEDQRYLEQLRSVIRDNRLEAVVCILGDRKDIPDLLAASDIYVMPSQHEAHSVAALESLASGVYCIFSGIEAFEPFATHPGVLLLKECSADAMARALKKVVVEGSYRNRYSREMQKFSMATCAAKYIDLANEIVARWRSY